ncbi:MAG: hypothetical protein J3K34DRAFT_527146 [Monoraphidium minutum]|nr:MAG: hypothetical protein J3K34DRAFT_527146 [Monoraphidium minutum]
MRGAAFAYLVLACALTGAAAQGAAPSTATFKAIGDYLGYKPADTDTVFVPTDAAFEELAKLYGLKNAKGFLNPKYTALLTKLGAYHIVEAGAYKADALKDKQQLKTIEGRNLVISKGATGVSVQGAGSRARVVTADQALGTAIVHVIDKVLMPPDTYATLFGALTKRPELKAWGALFASDAEARKKAANPQFSGTYFAPTDAAVKKLLASEKAADFATAVGGKADVPLVLYYHAAPHPWSFAQLRNISGKRPAIASSLQVGGAPEKIFVSRAPKGGAEVWGPLNVQDKATIITRDILIGAGVLHTVDFPLLPDISASAKQSVYQAVKGAKDLSIMSKVIAGTGILDELDDPTFSGTLLAPTDKAFEAFAKSLGFSKVDDILKNEVLLDAILGHHLVPVAYPADRLAVYAPFTAAPFSGGNLKFSKAGAGLAVASEQNSAAVTTSAGLDAGRSVVYPIDAVLLPDGVFTSIAAALQFYASASLLHNLVAATPELSKVVADPKAALTLFAPRNEAFLEVGPNFVEEAFTASEEARVAGLKYHLVQGARYVPSGFPRNGEALKTLLAGQDLKVDIRTAPGAGGKAQGELWLVPTGGPASKVVRPNVIAGQSVVHGVSRVLAPKGVFAPEAAAAAAPAPAAAGRRRLAQVSGPSAVFTGDSGYVPGTGVLRTATPTRFSSKGIQYQLDTDANQAAVQAGDTTLLTDKATAYTAGTLNRRTRADLSSDNTASAIRSGSALDATTAGQGGTQLWSNAGVQRDRGLRAEMAGDATASAIRAALDNPNDAFRATATGASQASSVQWSQNYAGWT